MLGPLSPEAIRAGPLTARRFVLLISDQTVSTLGSAMALIALAFAILKLTDQRMRSRQSSALPGGSHADVSPICPASLLLTLKCQKQR